MAQLQGEQSGLQAQLARPLPPSEIAQLGKQLKAASDELRALEERWLALSGDLEAIETER